MDPEKKKKWDDAYQDADIESAKPATVLSENGFLLPTEGGEALDLACGRAGNALFLAEKGFQVDAVDSSKIVLGHVNEYALRKGLSISTQLRDVEAKGLTEKKYDVIVVSYFLYRELFPEIISNLKSGGLLFYQTWTQPVEGQSEIKGPKSKKFRLDDNELLKRCSSLRVLKYVENQSQGDVTQGLRSEALIVAQKMV